jgi:hypothetical protein
MKYRDRFRFPVLLGFLAIGAFLAVPTVASATDSGPTITDGVCMQTLFGAAPSKKLNCTANDIRVARALPGTAECIGTGCADATHCKIGQTFTLRATFEVIVTANERYDAGFYFDINGDPESDGAYTGTCSLSVLNNFGVPGQNLDGGDFCGDLNAGTYQNVTFTIPNVLCQSNGGIPPALALPNCTSWHSNAGTLCTKNEDATPETKSKCNCDSEFSIPGIVPVPPAGYIGKVATQASVTYQITVHNTSGKDATLSNLSDTVYGNITSVHDAIQTTGCANGGNIVANDVTPYSCSFTVLVSNPGSSTPVSNTVSGLLSNSDGSASVFGSTSVVVDLNSP